VENQAEAPESQSRALGNHRQASPTRTVAKTAPKSDKRPCTRDNIEQEDEPDDRQLASVHKAIGVLIECVLSETTPHATDLKLSVDDIDRGQKEDQWINEAQKREQAEPVRQARKSSFHVLGEDAGQAVLKRRVRVRRVSAVTATDLSTPETT